MILRGIMHAGHPKSVSAAGDPDRHSGPDAGRGHDMVHDPRLGQSIGLHRQGHLRIGRADLLWTIGKVGHPRGRDSKLLGHVHGG